MFHVSGKFFGDFGLLWALWGHLGSNGHPDSKKDPQRQKESPRFDIILGSFWSPEAIKERSDFFVFF